MMKEDGWNPNDIYQPAYFGKINPAVDDPRVPSLVTASADDGGGGDFRNTTWWENGNYQKVSCLSLATYQANGSLPDDPSISITPDHFPPVKKLIKDIRAKNLRFRVSSLSTLNQKTGNSGVTMYGAIHIEGLRVEIDGDQEAGGFTAHLSGTVENSSPGLTATVEVLGFDALSIDIEINGGTGDPSIDIEWTGPIPTGLSVEVGACFIINEIRNAIEPSPGSLSPEDEGRVAAEFGAGRGIDCLAMEVVRALMYSGTWLEWIGAEDAAMLVNEKPAPTGEKAVDLSGTVLDTTSAGFQRTQDYLNAPESLKTTNWGLDSILTGSLLYGRDASNKYSRLVEWYASNWLCINLTDFQPYSSPSQPYGLGDAEWKYYDLICNKNLTNGTGTDGALVIDSGWPPSNHWFGGQGMILGAQGAVSHEGNASGGEKPAPSATVSPGSPAFVFAGLVALTPFAIEEPPGSGKYLATYNVRGTTLGCKGYDIYNKDDCSPSGGKWYVPWPPTNDDPEASLKFFHANVANGHDDSVSSGKFHCMWDFSGDGVSDLDYGNASFDPGGSDCGRLFLYDVETGRTGVHVVDILYEKGDWVEP
jgi:hypothetical protein